MDDAVSEPLSAPRTRSDRDGGPGGGGATGATAGAEAGARTDGGFEFDDDPARIDLDALWDFLSQHVYWGRTRTRDTVEAQVRAAWRVIGCYERGSGRMVGFARAAITGGSVYLADVYVDHSARGHGLGVRLVHAMIEDGPGADLRWMLHTADAHGLYERFGFGRPDATYLERPSGYRAGPESAAESGAPVAAAAEGRTAGTEPGRMHRSFDGRVLVRLGAALDAAAPASLRVEFRMPVESAEGVSTTPDLVVFARDAVDDPARSFRSAHEVVLAVGTDSAPGRGPSRAPAPPRFAELGVPRVWQVAREGERPVVREFAVVPGADHYGEPTVHRDRLTVKEPFALDVDLDALFG